MYFVNVPSCTVYDTAFPLSSNLFKTSLKIFDLFAIVVTNFTFEKFLFLMNWFIMSLQSCALCPTVVTSFIFEWFLIIMCHELMSNKLMSTKLIVFWESAVTNVTDKCFFSTEPFLCEASISNLWESFYIHIAFHARKNNGVTFVLEFVILDLDFFTIWFWLVNCRIQIWLEVNLEDMSWV